MRKVFWDDPHQEKLLTKVREINGNCILLKETIAFSFSGGQESDRAFLNRIPIVSSEIKGHHIYYILEEGHGLKTGDYVMMEIDWDRRYQLMRLHFAAELILELITRKLGPEKIGAHIAETKARIDFFFDKNISFIFEEILTDYNALIEKDVLIQTGFSDREKQRRFWQIEGFAKVSCGGTHVKSTREVGYVNLNRVNIGRGKERIEIKLRNTL